jgi:hypothetical protein
VLVLCTQVNMIMFVMLLWVYISTLSKLEKYATVARHIFQACPRCGYTLLKESLKIIDLMHNDVTSLDAHEKCWS